LPDTFDKQLFSHVAEAMRNIFLAILCLSGGYLAAKLITVAAIRRL
jgi:hypothetical protein